MSASAVASGQQSWEYSPYQVQVWLVVDSSAALTGQFKSQLSDRLVQQSESEMPAVWSLEPSDPPAELAADMTLDLQLIRSEDIERLGEDALQADKLMLLRVTATASAYELEAREFDCRARWFGPVVRRSVRQPQMLPRACFSTLLEAFSPIVRIEDAGDSDVTVRLRAGGLILDQDSRAYIAEGDILQPIIRSNDRLGKPISVTAVDWTFLQVDSRNATNPNLLNCYVHSAWRSPIRGRGGARREQYALAIRPTGDETELVIESKPLRSDDSPYPLSGLEIYAKRPTTQPPRSREEKEAEERRSPAKLLGLTDWRGRVTVGRDDPHDLPLRLLYVKNGGQLLARLPIVPGLQPAKTAQMPDDDPRLEAEGFIKGYQGELMDLVAQRKILAALFDKRLEEGELDGAQEALEQFRQLPSRAEMVRRLQQARARQRSSPHRAVQYRIEVLYADTRKMLSTHLDPKLHDRLSRQLNQAQRGG